MIARDSPTPRGGRASKNPEQGAENGRATSLHTYGSLRVKKAGLASLGAVMGASGFPAITTGRIMREAVFNKQDVTSRRLGLIY